MMHVQYLYPAYDYSSKKRSEVTSDISQTIVITFTSRIISLIGRIYPSLRKWKTGPADRYMNVLPASYTKMRLWTAMKIRMDWDRCVTVIVVKKMADGHQNFQQQVDCIDCLWRNKLYCKIEMVLDFIRIPLHMYPRTLKIIVYSSMLKHSHSLRHAAGISNILEKVDQKVRGWPGTVIYMGQSGHSHLYGAHLRAKD